MGLRDRACAAILDKTKTRILMVLHRDSHHEYWTLPGGKRENHETLEEAAQREVFEETSLRVEIGRAVFDETYEHQGQFEICRCFMGTVVGDYEVSLGLDPEETHLPGEQKLLAGVQWKLLTDVSTHRQIGQVISFLHNEETQLFHGISDTKLPCPSIRYFRVHTEDIAYATNRPRGLFVAIGKLVEGEKMTKEETEEYWANRNWFEEKLPVPPFYSAGNPEKAITWYKNNPVAVELYKKMEFYRRMARKYGVALLQTSTLTCPGRVIYEDDFQIAVTSSEIAGSEYLVEKIS